MDKKKRLSLVARLIELEDIPNQESLKHRLDRSGFKASQASLSRDLKELGAIRIRRANGTFAYALPEVRPAATTEQSFERRLAASATGVRRTGFIVLVLSPPGEAQLIGRLIDLASMPGLAGTLAGDDTVVCFAESEKVAKVIEKKLKKIIN